MYENQMYEKISAMNTRFLLNAITYRNGIESYLKRDDVSQTARDMMQKELEKTNYVIESNAELRIGLSDYLRNSEKKPVVFAEANQKRLEAVLTAAD